MESAGIVLAGHDPRARRSWWTCPAPATHKMWEISSGPPTTTSCPCLAAGVLALVGVVLSSAAGAVLMSMSTIVVALNAQLLRRVKLNPSQAR